MKKHTQHAHHHTPSVVNKSELVHQIASKAEANLKVVEQVVDAFTDVVCDNVAKGNVVRLMGFGTWELRPVAERKFRPINNAETMITLPPGKRVGFQVGAVLAKAAK